MAKIMTTRLNLGRATGLIALAVAATSLAAPTIAAAQEQGPRGGEGGWRGGGGRGGEWRGGQGGGGSQNRVDRPTQEPQRAPQVPAPQAPSVQPQAQSPRGDWGRRQGQDGQPYRSGGDRQSGWTDAQREAYRGAVLEGRNTDQFRNRGNWQSDRQDNRGNDSRGPGRWQGGRNDDRRDDRDGRGRPESWQNRGGDRSGWQDNRGGTYGRESWRNNGTRDRRAWDRGWRGNDRYNWLSYRSRNRTIFSSGRYYAPYRNYSYRRLNIGFSLGAPFFGSQYWINDPYQYRLPEAYGPYRWVRYYDDVLLVDTYSGQVVDAIYDFFY